MLREGDPRCNDYARDEDVRIAAPRQSHPHDEKHRKDKPHSPSFLSVVIEFCLSYDADPSLPKQVHGSNISRTKEARAFIEYFYPVIALANERRNDYIGLSNV